MDALADTSYFIAHERRRSTTTTRPDNVGVSVVSIAELRLGVLVASTAEARSARLRTLLAAEALDPIPISSEVAHEWAALRVRLRDAGRSMPVNDSWIAATALAHDLAVVTRDDDFDGIPGLTVIPL